MPCCITISQVLDSEQNSFNLVRLLAALSVLVSHSFSIQMGILSSEPLTASTPFSLDQHAVNGFFVLSGLTLSYSLERNPDLVRYGWSRFLRIIPALFACGIVLSFIAGPLLTSLRWTEYFSDAVPGYTPLRLSSSFPVPFHRLECFRTCRLQKLRTTRSGPLSMKLPHMSVSRFLLVLDSLGDYYRC